MVLSYPPSKVAGSVQQYTIHLSEFPDGSTIPYGSRPELANKLSGEIYIRGPVNKSFGRHIDARKCVFWNGGHFETAWCEIRRLRELVRARIFGDLTTSQPHETAMEMYFPIDPRVKEIDVLGAVEAYQNEDNTAWLFRHTQEGTHHDYELTLLSAVDGVAQPILRQYQVDMLTGGSESARSQAQRRFVLMSGFYGEVVNAARTIARTVYLGEREQKAHPREGWLDRDITAAVAKVKATWTETKANDLAHIASGVTYIENSLKMPTVETRIQQAERLAKEKAEAAAAAAETPQSEEA